MTLTDDFTTDWTMLDTANAADGHYAIKEPVALAIVRRGIDNLQDAIDLAVDAGDTVLANEINKAQALLEARRDALYELWQARIAATFEECHCVTPEQSCPACIAAAVYVFGGVM